MRKWKAWEKETQTLEYQIANGTSDSCCVVCFNMIDFEYSQLVQQSTNRIYYPCIISYKLADLIHLENLFKQIQ